MSEVRNALSLLLVLEGLSLNRPMNRGHFLPGLPWLGCRALLTRFCIGATDLFDYSESLFPGSALLPHGGYFARNPS